MTPASTGIARSTTVLALATGISRLLGFVRDILIARLFGTGVQAQAFIVAFRLPNLLRDLVAEGAVTSGIVPVLTRHRTRSGQAEFWRLASVLFSRVAVLVCVLGAAGALAAPLIVRLIAPGFAQEPAKYELTVRLAQILFPFITLVGLWAYCMGLLNSLRHFAMPALGPAILNLSMIAACLWWVPRAEPGVMGLAWGVMIGGVIQLAIQVPAVIRAGFRWRGGWSHPGASDVMRLLGPRLVGSAAYQAGVLIDTALASLSAVVGQGAVAALYFANRLVQLPLAVFGTAAAQASLPALSELAAKNDLAAFRRTLVSVLRMVGFVMLPSAAGLIALAGPFVAGLFERGAFDAEASLMTAQALACYALGLVAFAVSKVVTGAFYALHDTRTPVRLAMQSVALNAMLSLLLMWPLKVSGLALAAAFSNTITAIRLVRHLERRLDQPILETAIAAWRSMAAVAVLMGAGCWALWHAGVGRLPSWASMPLIMIVGALLYAAGCRVAGVPELSTVLRWLNKIPLLQNFEDE